MTECRSRVSDMAGLCIRRRTIQKNIKGQTFFCKDTIYHKSTHRQTDKRRGRHRKNYHTGQNTPKDSSTQTQKLCNSTLLQPPPVHFQHRASRAAFVPSSKRNKNPFNKFINHIISSIATPSITSTYPQNQCLYH